MRAVWSGSIAFGLLNIPVKVYSAAQEVAIDFDLLAKDDQAPIRYARINSETGEEVEWKDIVKGFEYAQGKYVVVTDKDFEKASPHKSKVVEILQFVHAEEIDPVYFERPYYLAPAKGAAKAYKLLLKALEETGTVGLAEWVMRNRQHICAIKALDGALLLHQMRYQDELKEQPNLDAVAKERVSAKELDLAVQLVEQLTKEFNPSAFKDTYIQDLKKIIKAKAAGKNIRIAEPKKPATATVKDLMAVLKQSLGQPKKIA